MMINWNLVFSVALGVAIGVVPWAIIGWLLCEMYIEDKEVDK